MPKPPNRLLLSDEQAVSVIRKPWEISIPCPPGSLAAAAPHLSSPPWMGGVRGGWPLPVEPA